MKIKICALLLILPYCASATCIVIYKTANKIYAAADSRSIFRDIRHPEIAPIIKTICKIQNVGNVFYAFSGHGDNIFPLIISSDLIKYKNRDTAIVHFINEAKSRYQSIMSGEKITNPKDYDYYLKNALSGVSFFGFKNNNAYIITLYFVMRSNGEIVCNSDSSSNSAKLGLHEHIDVLPRDKFLSILSDKNGVIYGLENLVKVEISYHPDSVNLPIDLLEITNKKVNWIRKKQICN